MSKSKTSEKPTLAYWKIRGLAQPIRLLLNYVGEDFEDLVYEQGDGPEFSRKVWTDAKASLGLDFPNLPYYIDGDVKITQSNAILRHLARKHNLTGTTPKEMAEVDMMLDQAMDFRNGVVRMVYNREYEKLLATYKEENLEGLLKGFENRLTNNKWFGGEKVTVADFPMYELLDQHRLMMEGCFKDYPKLTAFLDSFEQLPNVKKYIASDKFIKRPVNNKVAQFK